MDGTVKVTLKRTRDGVELACVTLSDGGDLSVDLEPLVPLTPEGLMQLGAIANDVDVEVEVTL